MIYEFSCRVYYEDTDLAGIVYYANYLRFIERARTEVIRSLGIDQKAMKSNDGNVFVVKNLVANYHKPAKFDDILLVKSIFKKIGKATIVLEQNISRDSELIFSAELKLGVVDKMGKLTKLPQHFNTIIL